jgi:3'-phosphoadenosine 5'-phosphosulfate (PAPS) 3'-phosphatase
MPAGKMRRGEDLVIDYDGAYARELQVAIDAALASGAAVRTMYDALSADTYIKDDGSPVTDADLAADRIIRERLSDAFPDDALLTEEGVDDESRLTNRRVWIVDPIDGTQQFIDRTGEFDVVIALTVDGEVVVGVLNQPSADQTLIAVKGGGAWIRRGQETAPFRFDESAANPIRLYTSVYFGAPGSLPTLERLTTLLGADAPGVSRWGVTPRELFPGGRYDALIGLFVPARATIAWEWDYAAPDLFTHEAGGRFTDLAGQRFRYNKPGAKNHGGLLMARDALTHLRVLDALSQLGLN